MEEVLAMDSNKDIDEIIAERLMSREHLGALMQESVVSNRKLDVDIDTVDVMLDPMYSPTWDMAAWVTTEDNREVEDEQGDSGSRDN
jgi:hypothetical protein